MSELNGADLLAVMEPVAPKRAARLAIELQREIKKAGWPLGEVIGAETDLMERYEVSRAVLREAVRLLEHSGVARMRRGPGGGLVVTEPSSGAVKGAMALFLEYDGISTTQLHEARTALELRCAELAATNATDDDAERLRRIIDEEEEHALGHDFDAGHLHVTLAEMTGNPAFRLFVQILTQLTAERSIIVDDPYPAGSRNAADEMHRAHRAIVEAVISRDPSLARSRMSRHLEAIGPWLHEPVETP